jgi:hypothetical protein
MFGRGVPKEHKHDYTEMKGYSLARLPFILKRASALSATNARDKIHGFLGLIDIEKVPIPVDYGNTVEEAYTKAAWALIDNSDRLDILAFAGTGSLYDDHCLALPSWVPDCKIKLFRSQVLLRFTVLGHDFLQRFGNHESCIQR